MVIPARLVVLPSASGDGLLCCLKYAVSQLLDTGQGCSMPSKLGKGVRAGHLVC